MFPQFPSDSRLFRYDSLHQKFLYQLTFYIGKLQFKSSTIFGAYVLRKTTAKVHERNPGAKRKRSMDMNN